jgi:outer membrane immunogenic protein
MRISSVLFGVTALAGVMLAGAAQAADLPRKAPPPVVAPPPVFSWSGFYIGGHVGAGWGTIESEIPLDPPFGVFPVSSHTVNGFLGGGQAGFNWQVNPWLVFGVEGQFSWSNLEGSSPCFVFNVFKCTTEVNWLATLAGRVGYSFGHTMLYVKGGVAWADSDYLLDLSIIPGVFTASASETRTGVMLGAGIEHAFLPNWSVKLEYNYLDFDQDTHPFNVNLNVACVQGATSVSSVSQCGGHGTVNADVTQRIHLVKFGLNYRFWGGAPVSARY